MRPQIAGKCEFLVAQLTGMGFVSWNERIERSSLDESILMEIKHVDVLIGLTWKFNTSPISLPLSLFLVVESNSIKLTTTTTI